MTTRLITRRRAIVTGLASLGGLIVARYPKDLPPTYGNLLRAGDTFTYAAQRALVAASAPRPEFTPPGHHFFPRPRAPHPGSSQEPAGGALPSVAPRGVRRLAAAGGGSRPRPFVFLGRRFKASPIAH